MPQPTEPVRIVRTWPARYKAHRLQVCEDRTRRHWIAADEVRQVLPTLRPDAMLQAWHGGGFVRLDQSRRWFFGEQALARELKRMGSHDALMLLGWLERTVIQPGERWRAQPALEPGGSPVPGRHAPDAGDFLVIADVDPLDPPNPDWPPAAPRPVQALLAPLRRLWRGQLGLGRTLAAGCVALLLVTAGVWSVLVGFNDPDAYEGHYLARQWSALALLLGWTAVWVWWMVGVMRSALRRARLRGSFLAPLLAFCTAASLLLAVGGTTAMLAGEWMMGLFATLFLDKPPAQVVRDTARGRIVLSGPLGFGSYQALERALREQPRLDLLQLESPGGFLIEGLAMARLVERRHLDTVSFEDCHSACTLLFTAGNQRWLGPQVQMGFHRSSTPGQDSAPRWNDYDHRMATHYRARGLAADFILQALDTPGQRIWLPSHERMLQSGVATGVWGQR